ncbi:DUF1730 domain-containing protein, partial [bacterium]|nr:DUF1730 domain-containing protein [bacterium]
DGLVSAYAARRDYHDVIKGKLKQLAQWLARESDADVKVFVDTAPLMEKPLAARAGVGWQGKHTNLVSPDHGSWLFLGAIFTTAELPPDEPEAEDQPEGLLPMETQMHVGPPAERRARHAVEGQVRVFVAQAGIHLLVADEQPRAVAALVRSRSLLALSPEDHEARELLLRLLTEPPSGPRRPR